MRGQRLVLVSSLLVAAEIALAAPLDQQKPPIPATGAEKITAHHTNHHPPSVIVNKRPQSSKGIQKPVREETEHISLVLVGDTGFPSRGTRLNGDGVSKYGIWQTWPQTTENIRAQINGDINFANMESVISENSNLRPNEKKFNFLTHPNGIEHLADTGFNLFSMANNHSFDYGHQGIRDSVASMDAIAQKKNIIHAGIGLTQEQAAKTPVFEHKDTRFAFAAIGIGAGNGRARATDDQPGQLNLYNKSDNELLMANLARANAQFRILSLHQGAELDTRATQSEISRVRKMLDRGSVDLLVGHHTHVARGVSLNKNSLVFYGLGNFLHHGMTNMNGKGGCRDFSLLARVHLVRQGLGKPELAAVEIVPLTDTHISPKQINSFKSAQRIAILNGLANQFDEPERHTRGIRFNIRSDGSGLYCTGKAHGHPTTLKLCNRYRPYRKSDARIYRAALNSCGRNFDKGVYASLQNRTLSNESHSSSFQEVAVLSDNAADAVEPQSKSSISNRNSEPKLKAEPNKTQTKQKSHVTRKPLLLSNKQLASMTKAQRKRYWTRYWYLKRGQKVPSYLR
ncbi:MAG: CapA family protein [Pseudomonadota bacterium]